ncbi:hypothetical protein DCAR_0832799 [Daucus carota subsp. sativus]|uniref:Gnk2-homologous domain-containing protein n=1 Tax=Daucus carota subsp. sativus TaxID=79200 RepID=A0AAF0XSH9_DAUCS|nr:hypothetical protein DCAR_0832799 [Daucus carota subsp. sativus]
MFSEACSVYFFLVIVSFLVSCSSSNSVDSVIYGGCSQTKYAPASPYGSNVNSLLSSLVNSAAISKFNNFKVSLPGSAPYDVVYGLFQCRGDLNPSGCRDCVSHSVSRLGNLCPGVTGGVLQLDGCLVKYDNVSFVGVEDKAVVFKKCGPSNGYDPELSNHRDAVLGYLTGVGQYFRAGGSGKVQGVAQCVQDLSVTECQDCLGDATESLRTECESAAWGDMFLAKCYVRYSDHAHHLRNNDPNELTDKTLAILIGLITGVILIIILLSGFSRLCDDQKGTVIPFLLSLMFYFVHICNVLKIPRRQVN